MGAQRTIERWAPKLYVEVIDHDLRATGTSAKELLSWIIDRGYRLTSAHGGNTLDLKSERLDGFWQDIIAVPLSKI